jgi:uncharacterized protein (DUF885 family)
VTSASADPGRRFAGNGPSPVAALAEELLALIFEIEPLYPTLYGLPGDHDRLADVSAGAQESASRRLRELAGRADAAGSGADGEEAVTAAVVAQQARSQADSLDARLVEYTITDTFVAPAAGMLIFLPMVSLTDAGRAGAYLDRLRALPGFLASAAERHRAGVAAGRTPVARLVEAAIAQVDKYLADPAHDPLARPAAPEGLEEYPAQRERVLAEQVRPAFRAYRDMLAAEVLPHARPDDRPGLCHLPGGDGIYASLVGVHTTTARTPRELHDTGLALIEQLAGEYARIGERVFGIDDHAEVRRRMREDPAMRWNDGAELLDSARTAIARAQQVAPRWFGRLPSQDCEVEAVPDVEAEGAAGAYYMPPALDGSRPGIYFANTHRAQERMRYTCEVTAFHEAVPGHHFQLTLAQELTDLPLARRLADVNAYSEGWGLYCERLADEMGLYSADVDRLGMLALDSMRACRLVVDTGLHALGWTRQQAIDYMTEHSPMPAVEIVAEVDRYIGFPAQALSYMVGRLEIQRIRAGAEAALGGRFDIREFHDVVLGGGALPLDVLARVVDRWVSARDSAGRRA